MRQRAEKSEAVERDDKEAFVPRSRSAASRSTIDWQRLSHALLPVTVRHRALEVEVATNADAYEVGESVHLRVTLHNRLPIPVTIRTVSPLRWSWAVDGLERASQLTEIDPPDRAALFEFTRRETKTFDRTWSQRFRESESSWTEAGPGEHTITAWINVADPELAGLRAETTIRVE